LIQKAFETRKKIQNLGFCFRVLTCLQSLLNHARGFFGPEKGKFKLTRKLKGKEKKKSKKTYCKNRCFNKSKKR